jgi:HK97 family phage portal protein
MAIFGIKTRQEKELEQLRQQLNQQRSLISSLSQEQYLSRAPGDFGFGDSFDSLDFGQGGGYGRYLATSDDVYSCIKLRSDAVSSVQIKLYQKNKVGGKTEKKEINDNPILTLLSIVNSRWTFRRLISFTEQALCLYGRAYWLLEKPFKGMPTEIWWVHPSYLTPVPASDGRELAGYTYKDDKNRKKDYKPNQVIAFDFPNMENQWTGLSPIDVLRLGLDARSAMDRYNKSFFENYGAPAVALETDKTVALPEQAAMLRSFEKVTRGASKAHSTVFLTEGTKANLLSMSQKDMEFIQGQQIHLHRVCRVYGIPPTLVGDLEHATLSNVAEYEKAFWKRTVIPSLHTYEDVLNEFLLPFFVPPTQADNYSLEFATNEIEIMQANELDAENVELVRWQKYEIQVKSGVVKPNEIREKEGMKPLPELDQPIPAPGQQPGQLPPPGQPAGALPAPSGQPTASTFDMEEFLNTPNVFDAEEPEDVGDGEEEDTAVPVEAGYNPHALAVVRTKVKNPGSRGGKFWYDDNGEVQYGPPPKGKTAKTPKGWRAENRRNATADLKSATGKYPTTSDELSALGWEAFGPNDGQSPDFGQDKNAALDQALQNAKDNPQSMFVVLKIDGSYVIASKLLKEIPKQEPAKKKKPDPNEDVTVNVGGGKKKQPKEEAPNAAKSFLENRPTVKLYSQPKEPSQTIELVPDPTAVYWLAFTEKTAPVEESFIRAFKGWLQPIENEVLAALRAWGSLDNALNQSRLMGNAKSRFLPPMEEGVLAGADLACSVLGPASKPGRVTNPVVELLKEFTACLVYEIRETAQSFTSLIEAKAKFNDWKDNLSRTIAEIEATKSANAGLLETYKANGIKTKMWVTQLNTRMNDAHRELHGQIIPIDKSFSLNGEMAAHPGQSSLPDWQMPRCRCVIAPGNE